MKSLAQCHTNKQSWSENPFGLIVECSVAQPISNEKSLNDFVMELVGSYAKHQGNDYELSVNDLSDSDRNELARLYIEFSGRELTECVNGNDFSIDNEYTCALLAMLENDCDETRNHFASIVISNVFTFYYDALQELIDNACESYMRMADNENGLYASIDADNGDVTWSRF